MKMKESGRKWRQRRQWRWRRKSGGVTKGGGKCRRRMKNENQSISGKLWRYVCSKKQRGVASESYVCGCMACVSGGVWNGAGVSNNMAGQRRQPLSNVSAAIWQ
jgi:hypothetical protein